MLAQQRRWLNFINFFHVNTFKFLPIMICLLVVNPVRTYPRPDSEKDQLATSAQLETLNSKFSSVNAKNAIEKPVLSSNVSTKVESVKIVGDVPKGESSSEQVRQFQITVPVMALPTNWVAAIHPSNAVFITQKVPLRIWAIGSVAKFPQFLENIVQRIQSYYSTYKYQDLSRPAQLAIINPQYHQHDTSGTAQTDPIDHDPIEEEEDFMDSSTTDTTDIYDTTTEVNYYDENDNTFTENGVISV